MRFKSHRKATSAVLLTLLIVLGFMPQLAHAATFIGYTSSALDGNTCTGTCASSTASFDSDGSMIQSPFNGKLTAVSFSTATSLPTKVVVASFSGTTPATTNQNCNGGGTCPFANAAQMVVLQDIESLSGLAPSTYFTVNLAAPVTVTANQWMAVTLMLSTSSSLQYLGVCGASASPACHTVPDGGKIIDTEVNYVTTTPSVGSSFSTIITDVLPGMITGATFEASGTTGQTVTVTQCYGNCGSPPITLANTNSTHTVNFNQSITLLYTFQSNINGFILNVTTNVAKSYTNGQGIVEAIYTVPSCPIGQIGFTQQCPGYLASGWNVVGNPGKGKITNGNYQIPIANGQWAAVSISGVFAPLDLNDTNTGVQVFQTPGGGCACPPPASISQSAVFSNSFKMGLWAWIIGNVVTSQPPTTPGLGACPGLDCILTSATNSFCGVLTTACQTGSALFWIIILTIISITVLVMMFNQVMPTVNIGRLGIGEIGILFFIGWIVIFTSFNLLSIYVLLLVFFVVAALSAKTVRGYVGI